MNTEKYLVTMSNAVAISAETDSAISKLPTACQKLAREITNDQMTARNEAAVTLMGIQASAESLSKATALKVAALVKSYNMDKDKNAPFSNWGAFAKEAWGKSASWVTQNRRVADEILSSKDETAKALAADFSFTQLAELLPLTKDGISPHITEALADGTLNSGMTAKEVREWVSSFKGDSVEKVTLVDAFFPKSNKRLYAVSLVNYGIPAESNDETLVVKFNPLCNDNDSDKTPWKAIVTIDRMTMDSAVVLYHKHKEVKPDSPKVKHLDATDRIAISIREMPEQFRKPIVDSYKGNPDIDYDKLCQLVGVIG